MAKLQHVARALPHWRKLRQLFDAAFYLRKYPDVAAAGVDPLRHYLEHGAIEGRKPHALFDPGYYLLQCPEAGSRGELPLLRFLREGGTDRPNPHPLFDCALYLSAHPGTAERGLNPLLHYVAAKRATAPPERNSGARKEIMDGASLEILDAPLVIVFLEPDLERHSVDRAPEALPEIESRAHQAGLAGDIVPVWEDRSGRMRFLAQPQQRPFFEAMKYDQLRAQINHRI